MAKRPIFEEWLTWGWSHKNFFGVKLLKLFCRLDHLINADNNCLTALKRSSLQTKVSKFTPKKFYEIDSWKNRLHNETEIFFLILNYNRGRHQKNS